MADENRDDTFRPTSVQVDRGRQQGLGVGARELDGQREPTDQMRLDQRRFAGNEGGEEADGEMEGTRPSGPPGHADDLYDARDGEEVSLSEPAGGAGGGDAAG